MAEITPSPERLKTRDAVNGLDMFGLDEDDEVLKPSILISQSVFPKSNSAMFGDCALCSCR